MNKLLTVLLFSLSIHCFSQTQAEMNREAYDSFQQADKELNEVYKQLLSEYHTDEIFIENLKKAQHIWIQFRDAELEMRFPGYPENRYGTMAPVLRASYLKELTEDRTQHLKAWIIESGESDPYNGSIKVLNPIDPDNLPSAFIRKDSTIWFSAKYRYDYRIFGYKNKDRMSEKMILLSVFTREVEGNPSGCKYGSYYSTAGIEDFRLKYISTEGEFLKIALLKDEKILDEVYMEKQWFEFDSFD